MNGLALLAGKLFGYVCVSLMWTLKIWSDTVDNTSLCCTLSEHLLSTSVVLRVLCIVAGLEKKNKTYNRRFHLTGKLKLMMQKAGSGFGKIQALSAKGCKVGRTWQGRASVYTSPTRPVPSSFQVPGPAASRCFINMCPGRK